MRRTLLIAALAASTTAAFADIQFVNGSFDSGDLAGWTLTGNNPGSASTVGVPGQTSYNGGGQTIAQIVSPAPDPRTGGAVNQVYGQPYSVKVGDEILWGGRPYQFNQISQSATVTGTQPGSLFFAWAAVGQISGHSVTDTPFFKVHVRNDTQGTDIYDVEHYEGDGSTFWTDAGTGWKYSAGNNAAAPGWTVEQLDLAALGVNVGDTLTLEAIARDCNPTGHAMYVYLDGFGNVAPPPGPPPNGNGVPDGGSSALLLGLGCLGLSAIRRKLG